MTDVQYTAHEIAEVCHEANRALQHVQGEHLDTGVPVAPPWFEFGDEQHGVVNGVESALAGATPAELHEQWRAEKVAAGWTHGPVKDVDAKTHPCLVDYRSLPAEQRDKDAMFAAIVGVLAGRRRPQIRVSGPLRQRNVVVDGHALPSVVAVSSAERVNEYQTVTVEMMTDDYAATSPADDAVPAR